MREPSTFVGLDVHKNQIVVAMLLPEERTAIEWRLVNEPAAVRRLAKDLQSKASGSVHCCYEAGPCGYVLQRQLQPSRYRYADRTPSEPGSRS